MKNYKINMNRTPLTDEEIAKGMNFNQVLKNYHAVKTPIIKMPKFWFGASALVAAVAGVILYNTFADNVSDPKPGFINPPVAQVDITSNKYVVDTEKDSTITYTTGSRIHVPAGAFLDEKGNVVKGKVELSYREFSKISEVFVAGIPMTYDSAGETYHFETAGMMEIGAEQNGRTLHTNPSALITVDMVSHNKEDRFNTYYLDTIEKKWKYLAQTNYNGTATAAAPGNITESDSSSTPFVSNALMPSAGKEEQKLQAELKKVQHEIATAPVQPKKLSNDKPRFSIKVEEKEFPEIAIYNNVKFEVDDNSYNPTKADEIWEDVKLKKNANDKYEITFSNSKENYTVVAIPVVAEKDYAAAKKIYDGKFAEYQTKLAQRKADEARLKAEMEARAKEAQERIKQEMAEMEQRRKEYEARLQQSELMYRTFQVNNFGVWNSDCPSRLPAGAVVYASMIDAKTHQPLQLQSCYLVEKGRNAMFSYYPSMLPSFRYDPTKDNMIWAVTNDLKVAVLKPEQFKASKMNGGKMELELNVIDRKFTSSTEVQEYLEI